MGGEPDLLTVSRQPLASRQENHQTRRTSSPWWLRARAHCAGWPARRQDRLEQCFLRDRLESHGLQIQIPDTAGRELVHSVIYQELGRGIFTDSFRAQVRTVIDDLVARGAEGVILGCTDIELRITQATARCRSCPPPCCTRPRDWMRPSGPLSTGLPD